MTARIDPDLAEQLGGDPHRRVEAIVRCKGGLDGLLASLPDGIAVQHIYPRINCAAVRGSARDLLRLAEVKTVESMEPVRPVSSF